MAGDTSATERGAVEVCAEPGRLPQTSDRAAVFFANLTGLFFGEMVGFLRFGFLIDKG